MVTCDGHLILLYGALASVLEILVRYRADTTVYSGGICMNVCVRPLLQVFLIISVCYSRWAGSLHQGSS